MTLLLTLTTFLIAAGGLLYEIYLGSFGSYLFGDSVKVFSLTTGLYMFSMGVGAFSVKPDARDLGRRLLWTELALMALHVASPFVIWHFFLLGVGTNVFFWAVLLISGTLVGTEIPLVLGLAREREGSSDARVHQILAADYAGALAASLAFGYWLLPRVGFVGSAAAATLVEGLGALGLLVFVARGRRAAFAAAVGALLASGLWVMCNAQALQRRLEERWIRALVGIEATVTRSEWTGFTNLSLVDYVDPRTETRGLTLLLDRQAQWSTEAELAYYHELLTLPAVESFRRVAGHLPRAALIIGGGDGFVAHTLRATYQLPSITLVDIDRRVSELAVTEPRWRAAGGQSLLDPAVHVLHQDAFRYVLDDRDHRGAFDLAVIDLPDPRSAALARFFTPAFFAALGRLLSPEGHVTIQASSSPQRPEGRRNYVCSLQQSLQAAGFASAVLIGNEYDAYIVGARRGLRFPEAREALPGRYLTTGDRVRIHLTDVLKLVGPNCPRLAQNTLLRPTLLDY